MPTISPYGSLTLDLFVNYPPGLEILNLGKHIIYLSVCLYIYLSIYFSILSLILSKETQ